MSAEKLVRMANQIGTFFRHEGEDAAAKSTRKHIKEFWDPRMQRDIIAHYAAGGAGLDPIPLKAVAALAATEKATVA
jgi:formate dehydrogenase subunit delta